MMRAALAGAVRLIWPDADVAAVGGFDEAAEALAGRGFDLVLCDLAMPGAGPIEGVARLMRLAGATPILIITGSEDDRTLLALLDLGVAGFLSEEDFSWITLKLLEIADQYCAGRVVSVLEGGYDLQGLAGSVGVHLNALMHGEDGLREETEDPDDGDDEDIY